MREFKFQVDTSERSSARNIISEIFSFRVGPFSSCFDYVDPSPFYDSCLYDLCFTLPDDDLLCDSLANYADACRSAGGIPGDWRADRAQCGELEWWTTTLYNEELKTVKTLIALSGMTAVLLEKKM